MKNLVILELLRTATATATSKTGIQLQHEKLGRIYGIS